MGYSQKEVAGLLREQEAAALEERAAHQKRAAAEDAAAAAAATAQEAGVLHGESGAWKEPLVWFTEEVLTGARNEESGEDSSVRERGGFVRARVALREGAGVEQRRGVGVCTGGSDLL